jgi:hypothetical protein
MRHIFAALAAIFTIVASNVPDSRAAPAAKSEFLSREAAIDWIDTYRLKPEPARLPGAVRALSKSGALREPDTAGFHVGFIAGVLGANPERADALVERMLPLPASDQWALVRAIAYSGLPGWRRLLRKVAPRMPARREMIEQYLAGKLPTLDAIELDKSPTFLEKIRMHFSAKDTKPKMSFGHNPELLDTLWGQYFATGDYRPVWRILTMLPWAKERDSVDRLTVGAMAKVTLANNAARYPDLLALLKEMAPYQPEEVSKPLAEVVEAAETGQTGHLRRQALASIDELKRKGPGYKRDVALWSQVGQGAIALGCIGAAVASLTSLGLPCVIGGAVSSAALNYWGAQ